jgi:hypothetical protein
LAGGHGFKHAFVAAAYGELALEHGSHYTYDTEKQSRVGDNGYKEEEE